MTWLLELRISSAPLTLLIPNESRRVWSVPGVPLDFSMVIEHDHRITLVIPLILGELPSIYRLEIDADDDTERVGVLDEWKNPAPHQCKPPVLRLTVDFLPSFCVISSQPLLVKMTMWIVAMARLFPFPALSNSSRIRPPGDGSLQKQISQLYTWLRWRVITSHCLPKFILRHSQLTSWTFGRC
ncbi:hypothetical protein BDN72DRAFT_337890 [Pluteus cervinus]|uniref:Uncharacterized protein n=1 Tax=Pluteus cervinus TaxID=181527 RepID=A0ACD3ACP9_9AGAR|nr:hypothetical protein BDN72DRAFT_337890 [Pluteus cervinus]